MKWVVGNIGPIILLPCAVLGFLAGLVWIGLELGFWYAKHWHNKAFKEEENGD